MYHSLSGRMSVITGLTFILGTTAFAQCMHQQGASAQAGSKKSDPMIVCPVMNNKVAKSKAISVAYKSKNYYLCCKMCVEPFNKNPQKYIKAAAKYADPIKVSGRKNPGQNSSHNGHSGNNSSSGSCGSGCCGH